ERTLRGQPVGEDEAEVRFLEVVAFGTPRSVVAALIAVGRTVELPAVATDDEAGVDDRLASRQDLLPLATRAEVRRRHGHRFEIADSEAEGGDEPARAHRRRIDDGGGDDGERSLPARGIRGEGPCA